MSDVSGDLAAFLDYVQLLKGDEKGEAQVFCDRLFQAFGDKGYKEAGWPAAGTVDTRLS